MTFGLLAIIVIVNALATIALWRDAARRPAKLKKKIYDPAAARRAHRPQAPAAAGAAVADRRRGAAVFRGL